MTREPDARDSETSRRKLGFSSGAPPVMSTTAKRKRRTASRTCSATSAGMISVRRGEASTWQCLHAWLQSLPTLT